MRHRTAREGPHRSPQPLQAAPGIGRMDAWPHLIPGFVWDEIVARRDLCTPELSPSALILAHAIATTASATTGSMADGSGCRTVPRTAPNREFFQRRADTVFRG
jgi:hypothetical protein